MIDLEKLKNDLIENGLNSEVTLDSTSETIRFIISDLPKTRFYVTSDNTKILPICKKATQNLRVDIVSGNNRCKFCWLDAPDNDEEVYLWVMGKCLNRRLRVNLGRESKKLFKYLRKIIKGEDRDHIFTSRVEFEYLDKKYRKVIFRYYTFLISSQGGGIINIDVYKGDRLKKKFVLKESSSLDRRFKEWWKSEYNRFTIKKRNEEQAQNDKAKSMGTRA